MLIERQKFKIWQNCDVENCKNYLFRAQKHRVAHEKPAPRLVDQRWRRSRTLYRKL